MQIKPENVVADAITCGSTVQVDLTRYCHQERTYT